MLPDVPPTDKQVHVALVSVVCIRGGKLYHEHIYWDQASVLVQVGLLDPKLVPKGFGGLKRLPVYGSETAAKVLDERSEASNELISSWAGRPKGDPGVKVPERAKKANGNGEKGQWRCEWCACECCVALVGRPASSVCLPPPLLILPKAMLKSFRFFCALAAWRSYPSTPLHQASDSRSSPFRPTSA